MIFTETELQGAFLIEQEKLEDERGFFARTWCMREFAQAGIETGFVQCNVSYNLKKGTLRGLHYQARPYAESKLVRCTKGAVYDVIIDLRLESPTFKRWISVELSGRNGKMLYVPEGFAHGFLTTDDGTEVFYQMSQFYTPAYARGIRWDDPAFGIKWPDPITVISEKDKTFPDFNRHSSKSPK